MATSRENIEMRVNARDRATPVLNRIKNNIVGIGAAYLGWRTIKGVITDLIDAAENYEKVWNDVSASLDRHGLAVDNNIEKVKRFADQMQTATGVSDELYGQSIQMLLDYNNDLATSMELVKVAADLSVGGHMDLKAAVDLVGKASVGYTGTLSRYGIIIDQNIPKTERFQKAIEQINQRFGGAAQARMKTYAGQVALLEQTFGDLKEQIGMQLLPVLTDLAKEATQYIGIDLPLAFKSAELFINKFIGDIKSNYYSLQADLMEGSAKLYELMGRRDMAAGMNALAEGARAAAGEFEHLSFEQISEDLTNFLTLLNKHFNKDTLDITPNIDNAKLAGLLADSQMIHLDYAAEIDAIEREQTDGYEREAEERHDLNEYYLGKSLEAHRKITQQREKFEKDFTNFNRNQSRMITDDIVDSFFGAGLDLEKIFKRWASDYIKYFLNSIFSSTQGFFAPGGSFLGLFRLFDVSANDRMIENEGSRAASYFMRGYKNRLANELNGATLQLLSSGSADNWNLSSLEREIRLGNSNILLNDNLTGAADAILN